jgi:glycosyltransferase involved in cell wall biosynthesis
MAGKRLIVLTFINYYLPAYKSGGHVRTISNMVNRLGDELDFRIVTSDRDFQDTKPYPTVIINEWNTVGKARVYYASPFSRSLRNFLKIMKDTPYDVLYFNSFFHPIFTIQPLLMRWLGMIPRRPTALAPRGEFSEGALAQKCWKKQLYITVAKILGFYREITWQASSEYEAKDIRRIMGSAAKHTLVASDLLAVTDAVKLKRHQKRRNSDDVVRVCFLSRITPIKNLDYALQVLLRVDVPVEFSIFGEIIDDDYWKVCQKLIAKMPKHISLHYHGVIDHMNVVQELAAHDLFFLPTRGENFGHAIYEALASGIPVLISDRTPWRNLESLGVGWDLPLNAPDKFRHVIEKQSKLSADLHIKQRQIVMQYAKNVANDEKVISDNLNFFMNFIKE